MNLLLILLRSSRWSLLRCIHSKNKKPNIKATNKRDTSGFSKSENTNSCLKYPKALSKLSALKNIRASVSNRKVTTIAEKS